jgi:hypothetical protein
VQRDAAIYHYELSDWPETGAEADATSRSYIIYPYIGRTVRNSDFTRAMYQKYMITVQKVGHNKVAM